MKDIKDYFKYYKDKEQQNVFEMAYPRKRYKEFFVSDISDQVVENYCLIIYALTHDNFPNDDINHWKQELRTQLLRLCRLEIKGNSTFDAKRKAIEEVWINELEMNSYDTVYKTIVVKFEEEGIESGFDDVIITFINNLHILIELIALGKEDKIKQYIKEL